MSARRRCAVALAVTALLLCTACAPGLPWSPATWSAAAGGPGTPQGEASAGAAPTPPAPVRIVTIGDSIMAGYGLDPADAWPALLATDEGATVTNLGCSGAGFVSVGDCDVSFDGLIDEAVAADPDIVIIQSSDNDDGEDDLLAGATMSTLVALRDALPRARIVGLSTLWNQPWEEPDEIDASTDALEDAVRAVGGTFVDIGQPLSDDPDLMQFDDEHPTAAGQEALLEAILAALAGEGVTL